MSNPRFSVADAKVLRVFGIAKPIHYFFSKKFQIRDFLGENDEGHRGADELHKIIKH